MRVTVRYQVMLKEIAGLEGESVEVHDDRPAPRGTLVFSHGGLGSIAKAAKPT